jgi:hypothetical protein
MQSFEITLFGDDGIVAQGIPVPFLPLPGMKIVTQGDLWDVISQPQIMLGDRSKSFQPDTPVMVSIRVRPGTGIHDVDPADETLDPLERYEYARRRYVNATEDYPKARDLAAQIVRRASEEYEAADAMLREFEVSPGVPKPEFRGAPGSA